jgi:hypothetical protein
VALGPRCELGEDVHRYSERYGVQVLALLRTNGFRSIREGQIAVSHDISRLLGWTGAFEEQEA